MGTFISSPEHKGLSESNEFLTRKMRKVGPRQYQVDPM